MKEGDSARVDEQTVMPPERATAAENEATHGLPRKTPERWAWACKEAVELIGRVNRGADLACEIAELLMKQPSDAELLRAVKGLLSCDAVQRATQATDINLATWADRAMWAIKRAEGK